MGKGVFQVLNKKDGHFTEKDEDLLIAIGSSAGIALENATLFNKQKQFIEEQKLLLSSFVDTLSASIDARDKITSGHSKRVTMYTMLICDKLNFDKKQKEVIRQASLLHDIGKIGIPENVLKKPSMLNDEEWEIMKQHPAIGAEKVLAPNESLRDLIPMVKFHHEHYDGSGYPFGLKGDEIPLSARIVSIADAYHALVSDRPYRKGLGVEKACEILKLGAGVQWDKELVRQFIVIAPSLSTEV